MSASFAFLHHVAAFALFGGVLVQFVSIKDPLTLASARRLQVADMIVGLAAGVVLVVGLLRVFYFEKGAAYYFSSAPFIAKLSLFVLIALASAYPTVQFLSWRAPVKRGETPAVTPGRLRAIRVILHFELIGLTLLILFAVLMARGYGVLA